MAWGGKLRYSDTLLRELQRVLTTHLEHACVRAHTHTHPHTQLHSADLWLELSWFRRGVWNAEKADLDAGFIFCPGL